jgi:hypothetical protein
MNWGVEDFVAAGVLLAGVAGCFLLARRWWSSPAYLAGLAIAGGAGLVTIWVSLAVGIIAAEGNPANLIYAAVILVAAGGAALSRLEAGGMSRAMLAAAGVQAAACCVAVAVTAEQGAGFATVAAFNILLLMAFLVSAGLFGFQARQAGPA